MKFRGKEIGIKPDLNKVEEYVIERGLFCNAKDAFDYWNKKEWKTNKGEYVKTLEGAINVFNSIAVQREVTKLKHPKKKTKKDKDYDQKRATIIANYIKSTYKKSKESYVKYEQQLKDKRWEAFRKFVLFVRGSKCEICGSTKVLQVHHKQYTFGSKAWEYNVNQVMVVCIECHNKIHGNKKNDI